MSAVTEAPTRTASGREISGEELKKAETEQGVVENPADVPEEERELRKLGTFGRSGSAKQIIRQGSSSARRCLPRPLISHPREQ